MLLEFVATTLRLAHAKIGADGRWPLEIPNLTRVCFRLPFFFTRAMMVLNPTFQGEKINAYRKKQSADVTELLIIWVDTLCIFSLKTHCLT